MKKQTMATLVRIIAGIYHTWVTQVYCPHCQFSRLEVLSLRMILAFAVFVICFSVKVQTSFPIPEPITVLLLA